MALKFGSLFGEFKDQLKKAFSVGSIDTSEIQGVSKIIDALSQRSKELAKEIIELEKVMANAGEGTQEYIDAENAKKKAIAEAAAIAEQEKEERERLSKAQSEAMKEAKENIKGFTSVFSKSNSDYIKDVENLISTFDFASKSQQEFNDEMEKLKMKRFSNIASEALFDTEKVLGNAVSSIADFAGDFLIKLLPPQFRIVAEIIKVAVVKAFEQVIELNKVFVDLARNTGGLIDAAKLGANATGSLNSGVRSLKTIAIQSNLSVEEFAGALEKLATDNFGQTIGAVQDLSKATDDLQQYAITAGRMQKMYGADMSASVRNLFQNYGQSIGNTTKIIKEGADKALALGLNVKGFVSNFEKVTELVGEMYFRSTEEMTKMAMVATKLGVSVNAIASGMVKMQGINDLFQQQQKAAALGLGEYSKSLAQIYALRKAGKGGEAAKLEMATLAQSMQQFLDANGQINQTGRDTLQGLGLDAEQINAINKMAGDKQAIKAIMAPDSLTELEKIQVKRKESENITLDERLKMITGQLQQFFIDPIAKIIGPFLNIFAERLQLITEILVSVFGGIHDLFSPLVATIMEISIQVHKAINDVLRPIRDHFTKARQAMQPMVKMYTLMGKTLVQYLLLPIRYLGKAIGFIVSIVSTISIKIWEAFAPLFDSISELFSLFGEGEGIFQLLLDGMDVVFGWLLEGFGALIDIALWPLTTIIGWLVEYAINPLIEIFKEMKKNFEIAIKEWPLNYFFGEEDTKGDDGMVDPAEYAKFFETALTTAETVSANAPNAANAVFIPAATNTDAIINEALMTGAFGQGQINPNTNIVINNEVEGIFSDKQTIKKTV